MSAAKPYTASDWPIAAALLPFPGVRSDGSTAQDASADDWAAVFGEVADAGFTAADLTDSWVRPGDLTPERLDELASAAGASGLSTPSLSAIRRSVIDAAHGEENLAYSHRTIDAAAHLGVGVVSFGLHQALTPEQQKQLWFWTVEGHKDPVHDPDTWDLAVARLRELGRHAAEVGVLMSLELYEDTYLGTADSSVRLVEAIGLANVGLNPDIGNLVRLHRPIEDWREIALKTLPWSNYWHVKNYARDEDVARDLYTAMPARMSDGLINYREAFRIAIDNGFQGVICVEHYGGDGLSVSAANRDYLRTMVLPQRDGYRLGTSKVDQRTPSGAAASTKEGSAS